MPDKGLLSNGNGASRSDLFIGSRSNGKANVAAAEKIAINEISVVNNDLLRERFLFIECPFYYC